MPQTATLATVTILRAYARFARAIPLEPPFLGQLSIANCKGKGFLTTSQMPIRESRIDEAVLDYPLLRFDRLSADANEACELSRPWLDRIANSAGLPYNTVFVRHDGPADFGSTFQGYL
jgi:hypothetical protein